MTEPLTSSARYETCTPIPTQENISAFFEINLDPVTKWHSRAVTSMFAEFLPLVGLRNDERIMNGALLHDIGKSDELIRILLQMKKIPFSAVQIIRTHPEIGHDMLFTNGFGDIVDLSIVRLHHERPNGSGYPFGLVREEIPLIVQAFMLADVFDSIVRPSSFHRNQPVRQAVLGLASGANSGLFNPDLTNEFLRHPQIWNNPTLERVNEERNLYAQYAGKR